MNEIGLTNPVDSPTQSDEKAAKRAHEVLKEVKRLRMSK